MAHLERYTVLLYDRTSSCTDINQCRQMLFTKRSRQIENIPPTKAALEEHCKRAALQAGHIWGQCLIRMPEVPDACQWGWKKTDQGMVPHWTNLSEASVHCQELLHCNCQKRCSGRCKCIKASLPCTNLCACDGQCSRD